MACIRHIQGNVRHLKRHKSRAEKEKSVKSVLDIAYSRTVAGASFRLNRLKKTDPVLYAWLQKIDPSLWIFVCWRPGRHIARTSNAVECFWSASELARHQSSVVDFYITISNRVYEWVRQRHQRALNWQPSVPPSVSTLMSERISEVNESQFQILPHSAPNEVALEATLTDRWGRNFLVNLSTRNCSCTLRKLQYLPCAHMVALASKNGMIDYPHLFVDPVYTTSSWRAVLSHGIESINPLGFTAVDLIPENTFDEPVDVPIEPNTPKHKKKCSRSFAGVNASPDPRIQTLDDFIRISHVTLPTASTQEDVSATSSTENEPASLFDLLPETQIEISPDFTYLVTDDHSPSIAGASLDHHSDEDLASEELTVPLEPAERPLISTPTPPLVSNQLKECFACFKRYRATYTKWAVCSSGVHRKCTYHISKKCECEDSTPPHSPTGRRFVSPQPRPKARGKSRPKSVRKRSRGEVRRR